MKLEVDMVNENEKLIWLDKFSNAINADKRMQAALMLKKFRDASLISFLMSALQAETEPTVCIVLAETLGDLKDEQAITSLFNFFEAIPSKGWSAPDQNLVKVTLCRTFSELGDKRAIAFLRKEIEQGLDEETVKGNTSKGKALLALSALKDDAFWDKVIPLLKHSLYDVRISAVIYLSKLNQIEVVTALRKFFEEITEEQTREKSEIIIYTAYALLRYGDLRAFNVLLEILANGRKKEQQLILLMFIENFLVNDPNLVTTLLGTLEQILNTQSLEPEIAFLILSFLAKLEDNAGSRLVMSFLSEKNRPKWTPEVINDLRAVGIRTLSILGGKSEISFLRGLREKDKYVKKSYLLQNYSTDFGTEPGINLAVEVKKAIQILQNKS